MSEIVCQYRKASGISFNDCVILGRRFPDETGPESTECDFWILVNQPEAGDSTNTFAPWTFRSFVTDIWRAPSGVVYATDADLGGLYRFADIMDQSTPSTKIRLNDVSPEGLWGLDDDNLFVWGSRRTEDRNLHHLVFRWDGATWHELPPLPHAVVAIHGSAPDLAYAVGYQGLVARWDGSAWSTFEAPTDAIVSDVHVESPEELYAVTYAGELLEGDGKQWVLGGTNPHGAAPFSGVAKFQGEVYIGANGLGVMKRAPGGGGVIDFKQNIPATALEVRDNLIFTTDEVIVGTSDGERFKGAAKGSFGRHTAGKPIPPL